MSVRAAMLTGAVLMASSPAAAQTPRAAVVPDTVAVGDVFRVAVRVDVPAGGTARFVDTLAVAGDIENAEPVRRFDEAARDGGRRVTAVYRLSAWRPGRWTLPDVAVRLTDPDGSVRTVAAPLPAVHVRSVLPADTAGVEPRRAKGVVGADRVLWPWIAGSALLAAAAVLAIVVLARRLRRGRGEPAAAPGSARERALAALDHLRSARWLDADGAEAAVARVAETLRAYLAAVDASLGRELTTSELLARAPDRLGDERAAPVASVLRGADRVKFAGLRPGEAEAEAVWTAAYRWIEAEPEAGPAPREPAPDAGSRGAPAEPRVAGAA